MLATALIPSAPDLGKAAGQCRASESGPAFLVEPMGLKDRTGKLKLGWGKPDVRKASAVAGSGLTRLRIVLNYRSGLGVAPLKQGS